MTSLCNQDQPENIESALIILGDKWSALILRLLHEKPQRFKDFERLLEISPRTLSQRLDRLQEEGVIKKRTCESSPGYYEYHITKKGLELDPIIHAMALWGEKYAATANPTV